MKTGEPRKKRKSESLVAITLLKEAESTSETSVNLYQITRRNSSEESHLYTRRHENLRAHNDREVLTLPV
jgi:hypothetical protein